jgi:hypothetical protein
MVRMIELRRQFKGESSCLFSQVKVQNQHNIKTRKAMKTLRYFLLAMIAVVAISCTEEQIKTHSEDDDDPIVVGGGGPKPPPSNP